MNPRIAIPRRRCLASVRVRAAFILLCAASAWPLHAQTPVQQTAQAAPSASQVALENLVAPVALYPDDLIGLVLPASTYPLQIVQADRFLDARKQNPDLKPDERWHETVVKLLNYPEVIKNMSTDLDWTTSLGEAVVEDQGAVLEAVQRFRRRVQSVGNLKSDDKQTIVVEKEIITIVPANPQVIYVPRYTPAAVVVYSRAPVYTYYPTPYPVYYYPYPPGAAFASGVIWGAAIATAWRPNYYNYRINYNYNYNVNINRNVNRPSQLPTGGNNTWTPSQLPARGNNTRTPTQLPAQDGSGRVSNAAANMRNNPAGTTPMQPGINRPGTTNTATPRPAVGAQPTPTRVQPTSTANRAATTMQNRAGTSDAFSGVGSTRATNFDSQRGAASRAQSGTRSGPAPRAAGGRGGR